MHMPRTVVFGMLVAAIGLGACSNDTKKQNALLLKENEELRQQLGERNAALTESQEELREKNMQLAQAKRGGDDAGGQATGFEKIPNVSTSYGSGELTVAVETDVLFASGKSALKPAAKTSLDSVATVLNKSYADHVIRVEGHTDTDPIKKSGFPSNYHLGFERAYAVREYLVSRGVDSKRISLASYGPDQPLSTKPESRRVEIVVIMN